MFETCKIKDGILYVQDKHVDTPAIVCDIEADTLHYYGDKANVEAKFDKLNAKYAELAKALAEYGFISGISMYSFECLTPVQAAYLFKRAVNYTASGFIRDVAIHHASGDLPEWIDAEMSRLPIEI